MNEAMVVALGWVVRGHDEKKTKIMGEGKGFELDGRFE